MTSKIRDLWSMGWLGALVCALTIGLASTGCSDPEEEEEPASCTTDSDCDVDGQICLNGTCQGSSCATPDPSETCLDTGCPAGEECVVSPDGGCVSSSCVCEDGNWTCTADCGQSYMCAPAQNTCDTPDPSETCLRTGCPEGEECLPTSDGVCVPSGCSCGEDGNWICTADCGEPYACMPSGGGACPASEPLGPDAGSCDPLVNTDACEYGMECCCGNCYPSIVCNCDDSGVWSCYASDACFIESCEGSPCDRDDECDSDELACIDGVCTAAPEPGCGALSEDACDATEGCKWFWASGCPSDEYPTLEENACLPYNGECNDDSGCPDGTTCQQLEVLPECAVGNDPNEPVCDACSTVANLCLPATNMCDTGDPSETCLDTGCPEGLECLPSDDDSCVPSACSCNEDGTWDCTADCGQPYECQPPVGGMCPDREPLGADAGACDPLVNTESCEYGMECCCGNCNPSIVCDCDDSGVWNCYATDACFIPSCEGAPCDRDDECESDELACIDGVCTVAAEPDCEDLSQDACGEVEGCRWYWASGCPSGEFLTLEENACLPYRGECDDNTECPEGTACQQLEVLPECAVSENPNDPVCDACSAVTNLCLPLPR